jgi:hypothetical protein
MNAEGTTPARLRGFRERTPPSQRFSKTDLAKVLNSWNRLPHVVSGGAQKNFVAFMRALRDSHGATWEPDEAYFRDVVALIILFAAILHVVRQEGFPAYRANIACYLVAYLSHRTGGRLLLDEIWRRQSLSPELQQLIRTWSHPVDDQLQESAAGRNVTEWCKKEACWTTLRSIDLPLPAKLPPEWSSAQSGSSSEHDAEPALVNEHAATATCMSLSPEAWFALHLWGRRSGHLADWQAGIAHTLSSYAGAGWQKVPTPKQARQAIRIIEIAKENGFDPAVAADVAKLQAYNP